MSNADVAKGVYEGFAKGDVPAVLGLMADDIDWQEPETLPFENQSSPQEVAENVFGPVVTMIEGFTVVPDEIHEAGDVVFAIGAYRGKGANTGKELDAKFVHVWRIRDGKIAGFRTYTDTHQWLEVLGKA
jgi:ketosteroid isomerase-like protein